MAKVKLTQTDTDNTDTGDKDTDDTDNTGESEVDTDTDKREVVTDDGPQILGSCRMECSAALPCQVKEIRKWWSATRPQYFTI